MGAGGVDGGTRLEEVGDGLGRVEDDDGLAKDADGDEVTCLGVNRSVAGQ